jgi:hypothetical protein
MSGSDPVLACLSCHTRIFGTPNEKRVEMLVTIFSVDPIASGVLSQQHCQISVFLLHSTSLATSQVSEPGVRGSSLVSLVICLWEKASDASGRMTFGREGGGISNKQGLDTLPLLLEPSNSRSKGTSLFCEKNFLLSLFSFSHRR